MGDRDEMSQLAAELTALVSQLPADHPDYHTCRRAEATAYVFLGRAHYNQGDLDAAGICLDRAVSLCPEAGWQLHRAVLMPKVLQSRQHIVDVRAKIRASMEALLAAPSIDVRLSDDVAITLFQLAYHGEHGNQDLHRLYHRAASHMDRQLDWVAPHCGQPRRPGPPRVGFVSHYISEALSEHTISQLFRGLIGHLDGTALNVSVFTFEDATTAPALWAGKRRVALPRNLVTAQRAIAAAQLDVLIYLDIGMDNFTLFLAHARLAPCQCLLWGHPDTSGLDTMDIFLSPDCMEPDDGESHYSEKLVRLPGTTMVFPRPSPPMPPRGRADLGLPAEGTLFLCPQSANKFHPDFDGVLAAILRRVPGSYLVLVGSWLQQFMDKVVARMIAHAPDMAGRIIMMGTLDRPDFHALFQVCDVVLDPLHYSGGHTTLEAFAFGAPVVTWPGRFMRARHTAGFYRLMGIEGAIARDHDHYVELAVDLATRAEAHAALSQTILARNSVLYDDVESARVLERFISDQVCGRATATD